MLVLLRTPDSILDWATDYLVILFLGSIGLGFYNILSGVLRGLGDAMSALIYLIVASVINSLFCNSDIATIVGSALGYRKDFAFL